MIHKFYLNGYHIVLDVNSGAVFAVDACAYKVLEYLSYPLQKECPVSIIESLKNIYSPADVYEAYEEIFELYNCGMLFSKDNYDNFAAGLGPAPIKSMCLNIAHDCNLRCEYCFASQGDFGGGKKLMSLDVGKAAIDFLIKHSTGRHNLEIDFFGGEPLLNFNIIKNIILYARGLEAEYHKRFRFTLTTNGLLLNAENIEFINKEISNVVLSIDGRKEIHDTLRVKNNGNGSYNDILPKYTELINKRNGKEYYVRGTYTKYNLDFSKDVEHLLNLGFDQISVEPVLTDGYQPYSITAEDLPRIFNEYETLARFVFDRKSRGEQINFFHFMLDLEQGPCAIKRLRGCSCGNEYIAVTPDGEIYPCHQFVGESAWLMGNVMNGSLNLEMKSYFSKTTVYTKESCKNCWAKFYCSGGCNANNFLYEGSVLNPHIISCEIEKKRLECAIMIKAALAAK